MNINDDADWNAFLQEMEKLGLSAYQKYVQTIFDRENAK